CNRPDGPPQLRAAQSDLAFVEQAQALDYGALQEALARPAYERLKSVRGAADDPMALRYKAIRERMKKAVSRAAGLLSIPAQGAIDDVRGTAGPVRCLRRILERYQAHADRMKAERCALSFSDLEHRALRALSDDRVRDAMRERYQYVFVDEYQDVSDIQESILRYLSRGDNLFMVGDVKQSIYRFRMAEPHLFIDKQARYRRGDGGVLIALNRNFRSRGAVLALTNAVFERAMRGGPAEIEYTGDERLYQGASFPSADPAIELHLLVDEADAPDDDEGEGDDPAQAIAEMKKSEREALLVIERIRALLGTPHYDAKQGRVRPLRCRDIAVLSRASSGVLPALQDMMLREGVPAYADAATGYFDVLEVRVALSLISLIENRRQDLHWLAVLRSPIVGLTSEQLADIRLCSPEGRYAEAVAARAEAGDELGEALRALIRRLDRWRALSRASTLPGLIGDALRESGYYAYVGGLPGGTGRQANLDALCARAEAYDQAYAGGLAGFLASVKQSRALGSDTGAAHTLGEGDDVVRLMTVHKSKGLEFPVVFGLRIDRRMRLPSRQRGMCLHRDLGVGMAMIDDQLGALRDTVSRRAAAERLAQEEVAEEMRILYVLLTRAIDRLILVGQTSSADAARERFLWAECGALPDASWLDWLAPAAMRMPGGETLWPEGEAPAIAPSDSRVEVKWVSAESLSRAGEPAAPEGGEEDAAPFEAAFAWRYPHPGAPLLPLKLTASGLTRQLIGPAAPIEVMPRPAFIMAAGLTGAEKGTAAHAAMQALRPDALVGLHGDALREEIARQVREMESRGQIDRAAAQSVNAYALARFWEGPVGRRALASPRRMREWTFTLRMTAREAAGIDSDERMLVQGAIDLCFVENGAWVLVDYKTERADDPAGLLARYRPQLNLYGLALERLTGLAVSEKLVCLLSTGLTLNG
ncbi:MAG: UvrD-helicase domain-containing protein, partial [Clostridiales bacterium]|nr:UvrD-helicase domain-containing protein [Clostridiales bacterium]